MTGKKQAQATRNYLTTIIFSKNRACQLELLLRSLNIPATVLYRYDPDFAAGYKKLISMYQKVRFVREHNFKTQLIELIRKGKSHVLFLVDDDVMIHPFSQSSKEFREFKRDPKIICLSLRMSPDYRRGNLPTLKNNKLDWRPYARGTPTFRYRLRNWGCPMAVGAHIFRRKDVLPQIMAEKHLTTPCFLERAINRTVPNRPLMLCFDKARFVNNEINQVQTDFKSHTIGPSARELEKEFIKGKRLSLAYIIAKAAVGRDYFMQIRYEWEETA